MKINYIFLLFVIICWYGDLKAASDCLIEEHQLFSRTSSINKSMRKTLLYSRNKFVRKVKLWEYTHNKIMYVDNLFAPFFVEIGGKKGLITYKMISKKIFESEDLGKKIRWEIMVKPIIWYLTLNCLDKIIGYSSYKKRRYDILFVLQGLIECARIGDKCAQNTLDFIFWRDTTLHLLPDDGFDNQAFIKAKLNYKKEIYEENGEVKLIPGLVPDAPERDKPNMLVRGLNWLRDISPPLPLPLPDLPYSPEDAAWRYTHEVEGIGFSVFMHLCPYLRSECIGFEAYGLGREVIGDETYESLTQPFVQPPYRLNEDEMRRDVTTGGAAAAASSVSATGPVAAAAASSADVVLSTAAEGVDSETVGLLRKRI